MRKNYLVLLRYAESTAFFCFHTLYDIKAPKIRTHFKKRATVIYHISDKSTLFNEAVVIHIISAIKLSPAISHSKNNPFFSFKIDTIHRAININNKTYVRLDREEQSH